MDSKIKLSLINSSSKSTIIKIKCSKIVDGTPLCLVFGITLSVLESWSVNGINYYQCDCHLPTWTNTSKLVPNVNALMESNIQFAYRPSIHYTSDSIYITITSAYGCHVLTEIHGKHNCIMSELSTVSEIPSDAIEYNYP